jgi:hypothetical protein
LVKVVFAVKCARLNGAIERKAKAYCKLNRTSVNDWKRTRQTECDGIDVGIWFITEMVWTCREQFGFGV